MGKKLSNVEVIKINNILKSVYFNTSEWSAKLIDESINKKELSRLEKIGIEKVAEQVIYNFLIEQGRRYNENLEEVQYTANKETQYTVLGMCWNENIYFFYFFNNFRLGEINNIPVTLYGFYANDIGAIFAKIEYNNNFYNAKL